LSVNSYCILFVDPGVGNYLIEERPRPLNLAAIAPESLRFNCNLEAASLQVLALTQPQVLNRLSTYIGILLTHYLLKVGPSDSLVTFTMSSIIASIANNVLPVDYSTGTILLRPRLVSCFTTPQLIYA
jgi:hypothetical protein